MDSDRLIIGPLLRRVWASTTLMAYGASATARPMAEPVTITC